MTLKLDSEDRDTWINDTWLYNDESARNLGDTFRGATCFEITGEQPLELAEPLGEDRVARKPKTFSMPTEPTQEERELHELTHLPFRSWCSTCVKAKSRNLITRP